MEQAQYDLILIFGKIILIHMIEKDRKNILQNVYSGCFWMLRIQILLMCLFFFFFSKQVFFYKKEEKSIFFSVVSLRHAPCLVL